MQNGVSFVFHIYVNRKKTTTYAYFEEKTAKKLKTALGRRRVKQILSHFFNSIMQHNLC